MFKLHLNIYGNVQGFRVKIKGSVRKYGRDFTLIENRVSALRYVSSFFLLLVTRVALTHFWATRVQLNIQCFWLLFSLCFVVCPSYFVSATIALTKEQGHSLPSLSLTLSRIVVLLLLLSPVQSFPVHRLRFNFDSGQSM